jgi:hypothetical protein
MARIKDTLFLDQYTLFLTEMPILFLEGVVLFLVQSASIFSPRIYAILRLVRSCIYRV